MHLSDTTLILSATDLRKFLSCTHVTLLDRLTALGLAPPISLDSRLAKTAGPESKGRDGPEAEGEQGDRRS